MSLQATTSATVGPYFHIGMEKGYVSDIAGPNVAGERIVLTGRVVDGDGKPVTDAMVEIWQANSHGKLAHPEDTRDLPQDEGFRGFARVRTNPETGEYRVTSVKPGRVPGLDGKPQAPHLSVNLFMRGILKHLVTRIYFADEAANAEDAVLNLVDASRRGTLLAKKNAAGEYVFDFVLQGDNETVFFDA